VKNETRRIEKYGIKRRLLDVEKRVENEEPQARLDKTSPLHYSSRKKKRKNKKRLRPFYLKCFFVLNGRNQEKGIKVGENMRHKMNATNDAFYHSSR